MNDYPPPGSPAFEPPPLGAPPPGFPGSESHQPVRLAGFGSRLVAYIVDGIAFTLLMALVATPLGLWVSSSYETVVEPCDSGTGFCENPTDESVGIILIAAAIYLVLLFIAWLIYWVLPTGRSGRTLGKRLVGLQVVDADSGQPPGFWRAFVRYLIFGLLNGSGIGLIGVLWILFDDRNQAWHDKVASSVVIRT